MGFKDEGSTIFGESLRIHALQNSKVTRDVLLRKERMQLAIFQTI